MDLEKLISAVEKFFFDLIGNIIPCGVLLMGIVYLFNPSILSFYLMSKDITSSAWIAVLVILYVGGYALSSIAKYLGVFINKIKYRKFRGFEGYMQEFVFSKERYRLLAKSLEIPDEDFNGAMEMRSYILSQIKAEDNSLTRRFRFISLLNISVSTAILICLLISIVLQFMGKNFVYISLWHVLLLCGLAALFADRFIEFNARTNKLPFEVWDSKSLDSSNKG